MSDNEKSMWKGTIIFGLVNIGFVWLCTKMNVMLISTALILMIISGIYVSFQGIREDRAAGRKCSSLLCAVGTAINIFAMIYYIAAILGRLLGTILSIF